jgi:signal transduction histidine kinase
MSDSLQDFDERLERAKLDALKELAYGASHEINNPLANISARAQTLLRDERHPERRRALEAIHHQALRAHEMISDLMLFARPPRLALQSVDVAELVRKVVGEFEGECQRRSIEMATHIESPLVPIMADPIQLAVAVQALYRNAVEAIGQGGRIEVSIVAPTDERLQIAVHDNGPGVPEHIRPHIFDPFFSGREAGRGLGFGLSKAWRIVTDHGGEILVENPPAGGARFVIELPTKPATG